MNDLEVRNQQNQWMEPKALISRLNRLKDIQKQVMKKDIHFGILPGCSQNSLYQPGSQVLCVAFGIGHDPEGTEEFRDSDEIRYRIKTRVFDQRTGMTITYGVGECSSSEDKYAWRKPKGEEWENTPDDRRRVKYLNDGTIKQVRTNPADVGNTVLKMALKRAEVNGTIKALAASEVFTQDIEDLPEGMDMDRGGPKSTKPQVNPADVKQTSSGPAHSNPNALVGIVQNVKVKDGVGKNKDGKMFFVTLNDVDCSTFNLTLGAAAIALKGKRAEYTIEVNGKYTNLMSIQECAVAPVSQPAPAAAQGPAATAPAVEDSEAFATTLVMTGSDAGLDEAKIAEILLAEFNCTIDTVPAKQQAKVLERIRAA